MDNKTLSEVFDREVTTLHPRTKRKRRVRVQGIRLKMDGYSFYVVDKLGIGWSVNEEDIDWGGDDE